MKKDFYWIHKDYANASLNNIAQRLVEYHSAFMINDFNIHYVFENDSYEHYATVGTIFLDEEYTVENLEIINSLMNYNVYFKRNTEDPIDYPTDKNLDFIVSLAAGDLKNSKFEQLNRYIIDISPMALEKSKSFLEVPTSNFFQIDLFNTLQLEKFINTVDGNRGMLYVSNCFLYIPNCILFDIHVRLAKINDMLDVLRKDSKTWYINLVTPNGDHLNNVCVNSISKIKLNDEFRKLPWIS